MIIADPALVARNGSDEDCELCKAGKEDTLVCHRCKSVGLVSGTHCKECIAAETFYMKVTGDSQPGIRIASAAPAEIETAPLLAHTHTQFSGFHIRYTILTILIPMLLGVFSIFGVDETKTKKS